MALLSLMLLLLLSPLLLLLLSLLPLLSSLLLSLLLSFPTAAEKGICHATELRSYVRPQTHRQRLVKNRIARG